MNPKLTLKGCVYTLTVGRVLNTNVFQINLGKVLLRATLKVRLGSCLSLLSKWTTWTAPKLIHISQLVYGRGSFTFVAYITSPTSPPYVGKQLTALFYIQPLLTCLQHCSTNGKLCILVKAQPSTPKHPATFTN